MSSRLVDALRFLESAGVTHPAGCVAVTGYYDDPQRLAWSSNNRCPYTHPKTKRGLSVQYARRGWVNTA